MSFSSPIPEVPLRTFHQIQMLIALLLIVASSIFVYFFVFKQKEVSKPHAVPHEAPQQQQQSKTKPKEMKGKSKPKATKAPTHELLINSFRGMTDDVIAMDLSNSGILLAIASKDRSLRIFNTKSSKYARMNLNLDQANTIAFSEDSRFIAFSLDDAKSLEIHGVKTKSDGSVITHHEKSWEKGVFGDGSTNIIKLKLCVEKKVVVTVNDAMHIDLWDLKGEKLHSVIAHVMEVKSVDIGFDYVCVGGFTSEVLLYGVVSVSHSHTHKKDKSKEKGKEKDSHLALSLSKLASLPHHSSNTALAISRRSMLMNNEITSDNIQNPVHVITCSKDNSWKLWNIAVRHSLKEDPKLEAEHGEKDSSRNIRAVCLSPDGAYCAMSRDDKCIEIYDIQNSRMKVKIDNAHLTNVSSLISCGSDSFASFSDRDREGRLWKWPTD